MVKSSSLGATAADSGTMRSLTRAQEATGKAHITVQVRGRAVPHGYSVCDVS